MNALIIKKFQTILGADINKFFFEHKNKIFEKLFFL